MLTMQRLMKLLNEVRIGPQVLNSNKTGTIPFHLHHLRKAGRAGVHVCGVCCSVQEAYMGYAGMKTDPFQNL